MRCLTFVLTALLLHTPLVSRAFCQTHHGQPKTSHLKFTKITMLNALLAAANDVKVPLGIMCADQRIRETEISIEINRRTLRDAVVAITSSQPDLKTTVRNGVVFVQRIPLPEECDYLTSTIPRFDAERDTVEHLSAKLWMTLETQLDPSKVGFTGVLHPNPKDREIGPADLRGQQVKDILNWMVMQHGAAAWVALPSKSAKDSPMGKLWQIVFYDSSLRQF